MSDAWAQSFCERFDQHEKHERHDWEDSPGDVRECLGYPIESAR